MRRWFLLFCVLGLTAAHAETPGPIGSPDGPWRDQLHWVPLQDEHGDPHVLYTRVCRPVGEQPARVALIAHGAPPDPSVMPAMKPASCTSEYAQWFLQRGYMVVSGMRRGFGATGGSYEEYSRSCSTADFVHSALVSAHDLDAMVRYATALPYARHDGAVIVGQSAGGWAADGYAGLPHPLVAAMVSMAGGRGGHIHNIANNNCRPDQLIAAAGQLGRAATMPMLWIYTENDSFFAPALAKGMYDAFSAAGGRAEFHQLPAFGKDGHLLFVSTGGSAVWGPLMEAYLARMVGR